MSRFGTFLVEHRWLFLIALLSLLLKLVFVLQVAVVNPDAATYIAAADKYRQGLFSEALKYYQMPFYPLLLAGVHTLIPDWIVAGRLLSIVPLWLTIFPLYALTRRLFNHQSALWTALLFSVIPTFNASASDIKRDPLFLLFVITAVLFLVIYFQHHRNRDIIWFSFFVVLATLTRIEGVLLPLVALVAAPICGWSTGGLKFVTRSVLGMVAVPLIFAMVLWGLDLMGINTTSRLAEVTSWFKRLVTFQMFTGYQELMASLKQFQATTPYPDLHNNLIEVTRHYAPLVYLIGMLEMLIKGIFPTSILGLYGHRWRKSQEVNPQRRLLLLLWLAYIALNILFNLTRNFTTERYLWLPMVLMLPLVGEGIRLWWQRYDTKKVVALLLTAIVCLAPLSKSVAVDKNNRDTPLLEAGLWLQQYDSQHLCQVFYNDRRLPLYAEQLSGVLNVGNIKALQQLSRQNNEIDLIVVYRSNKEATSVETFQGFESLKEFRGEKKTVTVFKSVITSPQNR